MEITLSLWSHRNDVVHGRDSAEKEVIKQQKFFAIVSAYYDKFLADSLFIPNHLHHLFSSSPETMVKLSEDAIRCWISTAEEAEQTQLHTRHSMRGSRACLYKFLGKELPNTKPMNFLHIQFRQW